MRQPRQTSGGLRSETSRGATRVLMHARRSKPRLASCAAANLGKAILQAASSKCSKGGASAGAMPLPPRTEMVSKKDNPAVAYAAFLTLARLVSNQPTQTLAALNEHPEWMTSREAARADYSAQADVSDTQQR